MSVLRVVLIAATLLAVVASPVLFRSAASSTNAPSAYAAGASGVDPAGRLYANGNNNGNGNGNNNGNGNGNGNGNNNNNGNGNGNGNDNCRSGNSNSNSNSNDNNGNDNKNGNGNNNNSNGNGNNNNSNGNGNCNENGNNNGNGNANGNANGNGNRNANGNENAAGPPPPPLPPASAASQSKCFDVQEVGNVELILDGGSVTLAVPPAAGFPSVTNVTLRRVDPATVPPPASGAVLDSLVWSIEALQGCAGAALGQLPADANLGIPYNVPADKSKLQIARLVNGQWVDVPTVPDPAPTNPYISATIHDVGTYVVYQRP